MPLVPKPSYNQIFASQAPAEDQPAGFNNYPNGWAESRSNNGKPTIKQFNYLQQTNDTKALWILQNGACLPYDPAIEYQIGALVLRGGIIQKVTSTGTEPLIGDTTASDVVDGNQTQDQINLFGGKKYDMPVGGYPTGSRVLLDNGDIVKSTSPNNTNNPNVDMTGWAPDVVGLTFESFGVVLNVKLDQSSKMQAAIDFCEENGIKHIAFGGKGTCYLGGSVTFKPRKKKGTNSTFWGYSHNRLVVDCTNVIFTPIVNNFTMFKLFRDTLKFTGVFNIANGTGVDKKTGVRGIVNGMTDADAEIYPSSEYFQLCGFLSADSVYISGLETSWDNQAGYYNYYMDITEFVARDTNYAMTFLSPVTNKQDQNTRMRIGNFVHEGGFCSIYGECADSLQVDSFYNEGINVSVYSDTRSLIPDGTATGVYIPERDKWGFVNPYNKIFGIAERNDRPTYIKNPTSSFTGIFSRPTGNVLYPNVGLASNGFVKSEYPETIKRLDGIKTSGTAATYGVAITADDTNADPTIKNDLPVKTMTDLLGSIVYLPSDDGSFAAFTRTELLYVHNPFSQRGWWARRCRIDGTSVGVAWVRVGSEYVDSVAAKIAATTLTSANTPPVGLRSFNWDIATDKPSGLVDYMMGIQAGKSNLAFEILAPLSTTASNNVLKYRRFLSGSWQPVATILSTANTTVDANGFIKSASPIIKLYADRIESNEEANLQDISFVKFGVGDYLIRGSSGFSTDGWYIEAPQDANGNKLFVTVHNTLENGDISIKTYKRKFDIETAAIVADMTIPVDINEGRWIDIRLN